MHIRDVLHNGGIPWVPSISSEGPIRIMIASTCGVSDSGGLGGVSYQQPIGTGVR